MALRNIVKDGDPILKKKSRQVTEFGPRLAELLDDMLETVKDAHGLGLAAPQVGVLRQVCIVAEEQADGSLKYTELVNPSITAKEGEVCLYEGCLSFPGKSGYVARPQKVTVIAQDRKGNTFSMTGENMLARAICHEVDHLEGILFVELATEMEEDDPEELEQSFSQLKEEEDAKGKAGAKKKTAGQSVSGQTKTKDDAKSKVKKAKKK